MMTVEEALDQRGDPLEVAVLMNMNPFNTTKGGTERYIMDVLPALAESMQGRIRSSVVFPIFEDEEYPLGEQMHITYHPVRLHGKGQFRSETDPRNIFAYVSAALPVIRQCDVVDDHAPHFFLPGYFSLAAATSMGKPIVVSPHRGGSWVRESPFKQRLRRKLFRYEPFNPTYALQTSDSIAFAQASRSFLIGNYTNSQFDREKPPAIDQGLEAKLELVTRGRRPVLHVAALEQRKNQLISLDALDISLSAGGEDSQLIFVYGRSESPYEEQLRDAVSKKGMSDNVTFMHNLSRQQMPTLYHWASRADGYMILPSIVEGLPGVILEGMGFGIPVITTARDGQADVITDGRDGFLVPDPMDVSGFADRMSSLSDPKLYRSMSEAAYQKSRDFTISQFVRKIAKVYAHASGIMPIHHDGGLKVDY